MVENLISLKFMFVFPMPGIQKPFVLAVLETGPGRCACQASILPQSYVLNTKCFLNYHDYQLVFGLLLLSSNKNRILDFPLINDQTTLTNTLFKCFT